ncbi:MAG: hypothetical protein Q4F67_17800, partial [Propionibacteriaceae bacterium]|nr:hypothetical protein [Propionibacteriaceae bacterium]
MTVWLLVKRILRRRPGQAVTTCVLTLLAATLVHTALVLLTDYAGNIDRKAEQWNSPTSLTIVNAGGPARRLAALLDQHPTVSAVELIDSFGGTTMFAINDDNLTAFVNIVELGRSGEMGGPVVVEAGGPMPEGLWAPSVLQASGAYDVGDEIVLDTAQGTTSFRIAGFIEGLYGGAPGMGTLTFALDSQA